LIYDLQRQYPIFIPLEFYTFLEKAHKVSYSTLVNLTEYKDDINMVSKNIDFLLEKEICHFLSKREMKLFPNLSFTFQSPKIVTNTILHLSDKNTLYFDKSINLLNQLEHPSIEIWYNFSGNFDFLEKVLNTIEVKDFYSYNLHLNISDMNFYVLKIHNLVKTYFKVRNAYYYNTTYQLDEKLENHFFIKKPFEFYKTQNKISSTNFNINISLFTESQKHNTYFNRKLYIEQNGEIKNAPECEQKFGTIQDLKNIEELKQIIATPKFQKYWYVHKELIDVCKDCEFRHMCVDNRVPLKRKKDEWYHQTECNYNPYIAKWQGEEGYKTLEECGVVSNQNGLQINHKQLEEVNHQLSMD
jgi:SPASM domain peptide maturase of grasp-with-spasm system